MSEVQKWRNSVIYPSALLIKPGWFGTIQTPEDLGWIFPSFPHGRVGDNISRWSAGSALNRPTGLLFSLGPPPPGPW